MVYGKARDNCVEMAEVGQWFVQVMFYDFNFVIATKSLARGLKHRRRKVERNALGAGPVNSQQRQQPAISGSQIEYPSDVPGDQIKQDGFAFGSVWNAIGAREILERVLGGRIFIEIGLLVQPAESRGI